MGLFRSNLYVPNPAVTGTWTSNTGILATFQLNNVYNNNNQMRYMLGRLTVISTLIVYGVRVKNWFYLFRYVLIVITVDRGITIFKENERVVLKLTKSYTRLVFLYAFSYRIVTTIPSKNCFTGYARIIRFICTG